MLKYDVSEFNVRFAEKEKAVAFISDEGRPFKNAVIGITYPDPNYRINRSSDNPVTVFEYVLEGEGEIIIDGKRYIARSGDTYILRSNEAHCYYSDSNRPWKKLWINYVADYISPMLDSYGITSGIYHSELARDHFELLWQYSQSGAAKPNINFKIAACLHNLIQTLATESDHPTTDECLIREALNASVYEKLNLDELASRLHISKSNIIRVFKKNYGITPMEYLISLKISAAKILLKDTHMTVKEIAERLQISDEHYFSNLFRKRVGIRPRDYRNKRE